MYMEVKEKFSTILVEVAYALPDTQKIIALNVPKNCTVIEAVKQSKITEHFPEIDIENDKMGIFGKLIKSKDQVLQPGDRVEIYRPLVADPKEMRKQRAAQKKEK